eukprot:122070_1
MMAASFLLFVGYVAITYAYPEDFDCPMRQLALEFAMDIQPYLAADQLQEIADALNGSPESVNKSCVTVPANWKKKYRTPPNWNDLNYDNRNTLFVDYINGNDNHNGSISYPLKLLETAVYRLRNRNYKNMRSITNKAQIILRSGTHYLPNTIYFTPDDSHLLITNYNNENVILSGGIPIQNCDWKLYKGTDYYSCDLSQNTNINTLSSIYGLRVNGMRAVRSRYPNNNPEIGFGSKLLAQSWDPSILPKTPQYEFNPDVPNRDTTVQGCFQKYLLGVGDKGSDGSPGICESFTPPAGYFCSNKVQGGGYGVSSSVNSLQKVTCVGGALPYAITTGFTYNVSTLPNAPYKDGSDAIIHVWRPGHWATWAFNISEYDAQSRHFKFDQGGFQGGRGDYRGDEFYVENIFEELDDFNEWFYNRSTKTLYYRNNVSANGQNMNNILFEATNLTVFMNFTGKGMNNPIQNIEMRGMTIKDASYSYMEMIYGLPSGGDWSLARIGTIFLDNGTRDFMIQKNIFTHLDSNTISINRYSRNITIYQNEISWNGDNVVSAWGYTTYPNNTNKSTPLPSEWGMGYDGTNGNQPRGINLIQNYVHEIGIWEKQSSMWFQAKSCSNVISNNIFFNGPRAGINFNDGFGGNSTIKKNLLFNTCRESGDHGNFNSWDRQVFVTKVRNGTPSTIKQFDYIYNNFMIADYEAGFAIDNDDGSCYYDTHSNFFVYGNAGMKNDFGGHDNFHYNNIYGYVGGQCFGINGQIKGHNDRFYNNTCILNKGIPTSYGSFDCGAQNDGNEWPKLGQNVIYQLSTNTSVTGLCSLNEKAFQQKYPGIDDGTTISGPPNNALILQQAKQLIF